MFNELAILVVLVSILASLFHFGGNHHHGVAGQNQPKSAILLETKDEKVEFHLPRRTTVPDECAIVMADSSISNSGWGVFTLEALTRGQTLQASGTTGDVVIHLTDPNPLTAAGMQRLIWEYLWEGQEVGGQYEGKKVMSVAPGIGMLANGEALMFNVLPQKPTIDNAGVERNSSPGAGAFSHYHNLTWKIQKDLESGSELFVNYGEGWFKERGYVNQPRPTGQRSVAWLRESGYCMDNLVSGKSILRHAGRGAFANRDLEAGTVIAPVPVLPLASESLKTIKEHETGRIIITEQILRNYCFGHQNSSLLLFPYSSMVNLINHSSESEPNVKLQWSEASKLLVDMPISRLHEPSSRLLLELVAIRPIQKGEEIFLDYGTDWVQAWHQHVASWQPPPDDVLRHRSAQDANMDEAHKVLGTVTELQSDPSLENIFTSCYYRYSMERDPVDPTDKAQVHQWRETQGLREESRNLRPCAVMDRFPREDGEMLYTVRVFNRPGLAPSERVPKGRPFILTGVPRYAIEFSDKLYTSDQHLENAFRKEMGLGVFPLQWLDLS